jgi:hypothetical protein
MAEVTVRWDVDQADVLAELTRLGHPPYFRLESVLATTFTITEARVHVISGALLASGHTSSSLADDLWTGTLSYARYPGIFELARGNKMPTKNHPDGGHFFFDPVEAPPMGPYDSLTGEGAQMYIHEIRAWLEGEH